MRSRIQNKSIKGKTNLYFIWKVIQLSKQWLTAIHHFLRPRQTFWQHNFQTAFNSFFSRQTSGMFSWVKCLSVYSTACFSLNYSTRAEYFSYCFGPSFEHLCCKTDFAHACKSHHAVRAFVCLSSNRWQPSADGMHIVSQLLYKHEYTSFLKLAT